MCSDTSAEMLVAGHRSCDSPLLLGGFPIISLSAWWSSPWWSYLKILFPLMWFQTKLLHKRWDKGFNWLALAWGSLTGFSSAAHWCLCYMLWQNLTNVIGKKVKFSAWQRYSVFLIEECCFFFMTPPSPYPDSIAFQWLKSGSYSFPNAPNSTKVLLVLLLLLLVAFITVESTADQDIELPDTYSPALSQ